MNLKTLKNDALLVDLKNFVQEEKKLIKQILEYLEEVENRKLFVDRGFSSLFAFCTEFLGYTPQEAQVRIQAMRLSKAVPEVKSQIEAGSLSLTVAAKVQGHIAKENKLKKQTRKPLLSIIQTKSIVETVQNQSVRDSERLLFKIFPHHEESIGWGAHGGESATHLLEAQCSTGGENIWTKGGLDEFCKSKFINQKSRVSETL